MKVLRFIINMIWPFRFFFIGPFIMVFIYSLDLSFRPYLTKLMIDKISTKSSPESYYAILNLTIIYIIILYLVPIGWRIYDWCCLKYEPSLKSHIARTMIDKLTDQTHNFFHKNFPGSIANKVNDTVKYVPQLVTLALDSFIMNFVSLIVAIYALWSIHFWFAIAMSVWACLFIFMSIFVVRKFSELACLSSEASSKVVGNIVDILSNILNVRLFCSKNFELTKLSSIQEKYRKAIKRKRIFSLKFYLTQGVVFATYQAMSVVMLIYLYSISKVTVGDFAMLFSINTSIVVGLSNMTENMRLFSENWGAVGQALKILEVQNIVRDHKDSLPLIVKNGKIEFKNVKFHYKGDNPLFQKLSVTINSGEKVGLVGYSGSGKTSFANMILRLYDPNVGSVYIDGQDIQQVTLDSLRKSIAVIPQDTSLFHRSILENIRYGKRDASDEEVIDAAKKANAHDFIMSLPQGYNSHAGERGVKISTGQRQRIVIARAILKNAPILIFDEATSNLDAITENFIQENLKNIMNGRTCIVIAHKLSTLCNMDRILVFEHGKIIEDGSQYELYEKGGVFRSLWDAQSLGILPETNPNFVQ